MLREVLREVLRGVDCWHDTDHRPSASGPRSGPGPTARLLACCGFDPQTVHDTIDALERWRVGPKS
jgi:hypothetical protein